MIFVRLILISLLVLSANCLHEDQKGKFDWRKQYIGIPKFVHFDHDLSTILVGSESNVLASIRANDGNVLWRKLLLSDCDLSSMSLSKPLRDQSYLVRTVCMDSKGNNHTQYWQSDTGLLASESRYKQYTQSDHAESIKADIGVLENGIRTFSLSQSQSLQLTSDGQVSLILGHESRWTRHESLASIAAVEIVHLPLGDRDPFGLRKRIVILTEYGTMFGIDTLTGEILWDLYEPNISTRNLPGQSKARLVILKESDDAEQRAIIINPSGSILTIDPIAGQVINKHTTKNPVKQLALTEIYSNELGRAVIVVDTIDNVYIYPEELRQQVERDLDKYYLTIIDHKKKALIGYGFALEKDVVRPKQIWTFSISTSEHIIDVKMKRIDEEVHSPARVLGDRGILYKYVNPNLMAVMTQTDSGTECFPEHQINIYLIDAVTGALVHSVHHPKTKGPAYMIHSENWLAYTYYHTKYRRVEIASMELFEGITQTNSTSFSSISRSAIKPKIIEHKSFIFPSGINGMTDTVSLRGLTNKHLIVSLPKGGLLEIPKIFLDPRRPLVMTMEHREEGLIPYSPELPIPSESIINYDQQLLQVRGIATSPAMLESTSLVFAYGLDLFFTRVTPSKTFDILKDDFDHILITGVLIFLIVASYVSKLLAQRKALHAAWK